MNRFEYRMAETLEAALTEYAHGGMALKAGGMDLVELMQERIATPRTVLSIQSVPGLSFIRGEGGGLSMGCLVTLRDIGESELLKKKFPGLVQAVADAATPQVRERATLGGNLCQRPRCWYFRNLEFDCLKKGGHTCFAPGGENAYHAILGGGPCHIVHPSNAAVPLVAAGAEFVLRDKERERRVSAREFFVLPSRGVARENVLSDTELLVEVKVPEIPLQSATVVLREKQSFDWPSAMASVVRMTSGWRVCIGAVAPVPWLSVEAAEVLGARDVDEKLAAEAARSSLRDARPLSGNAHKIRMAEVAVKRALLRASGKEAGA